MRKPKRLIAAILAMAVALAGTGCDSPGTQPPPSPTEDTTGTPSPAPTAVVRSNIDLQIRPATASLSPRQQQVAAAFTEFINARQRFYSHPWIIDPIFARTVLPGLPDYPLATDTTGLIGPATVEVLSVEASQAKQAKVNYCLDDRAVRYMGRDGAVDIPGPAGDHRKGDVTLEMTEFTLTTEAAVDGSTSPTPRWLASSGTLTAGAKECLALTNSPPLAAPTQRPVTTTP